MPPTRIPPRREPGAPHATTIILTDLLPGTHCYADTQHDAAPILVVDTGPTEFQFSVPGNRITLRDLHIVDGLLEATAAYRIALISYLD